MRRSARRSPSGDPRWAEESTCDERYGPVNPRAHNRDWARFSIPDDCEWDEGINRVLFAVAGEQQARRNALGKVGSRSVAVPRGLGRMRHGGGNYGPRPCKDT